MHHLTCPDGEVALTWRYRVSRLWEREAEALLATGRPAVLALVGQTPMAHPEVVLPQVVATLKALGVRSGTAGSRAAVVKRRSRHAGELRVGMGRRSVPTQYASPSVLPQPVSTGFAYEPRIHSGCACETTQKRSSIP